MQIGLDIAEQQGDILSRTNASVGLGSYLVTSAGCSDCHTWPNNASGGNPFARQPQQINLASYMAGGRVFSLPTGDEYSRNIAPAAATGRIAGFSRQDFTYVIRTGCDPREPDPQGIAAGQ